jgi:hypothetical protein
LVISYDFVDEVLVLQGKFDVITSPIVVKKFIGDIVSLLEAELDPDIGNIGWFAHDSYKEDVEISR